MYICYTDTCVYIQAYNKCIQMYMRIEIHMQEYIGVLMFICVDRCRCMYTLEYIYTSACVRMCIQVCVNVYIDIYELI